MRPLGSGLCSGGVCCSGLGAFLTTHDYQPFRYNARREIPPFTTKIRSLLFILNADVLRTCVFDMKADGPSARTAYDQLSPPHEHDPTMLFHTGIHA